jgi:hypothetical protein
MRVSLILLGLAALPLPASAQLAVAWEDEAGTAAGTITAEDLYSRIAVLAHDSMRGRRTPSPELDQAAGWIASEFSRFGLLPGGDEGSFLQRYTIQRVLADMEASSLRTSGGIDLRFGRDLSFPFGPARSGEFRGEVVVVTGSANAQAALQDAPFERRHVVIVTGEPGSARVPAVREILRSVLSSGGLSVWLALDQSDSEWDRDLSLQAQQTRQVLPWAEAPEPFVIGIRDRALQRLVEGALDLSEARTRFEEEVRLTELPGVEATVTIRNRVQYEFSAPNVVGILEGGDPELKDEYVVFSAHMDHVGVRRADQAGDSIYNGADDDASGTAAVIEVAEAFSAMSSPPRRSLVFLLVSGEERGLWGSRHFTENSSLTASSVANLNLDMVGRNWPDTIVVIGKEHSDLGETLAEVNARHPELGMAAIDDLWPEENFYGRSDHYNFARKGVPILFFFNGTHPDYHRPSDEVEKIDAEKTSRIAKLVFYLGLEVATKDEKPTWDPESYRGIVSQER